jgi:hypothetical protein
MSQNKSYIILCFATNVPYQFLIKFKRMQVRIKFRAIIFLQELVSFHSKYLHTCLLVFIKQNLCFAGLLRGAPVLLLQRRGMLYFLEFYTPPLLSKENRNGEQQKTIYAERKAAFF